MCKFLKKFSGELTGLTLAIVICIKRNCYTVTVPLLCPFRIPHISSNPGRVQSRPCSSMMEKSALEKVNQEMVSQPQSKLFAVVHICECVQLPCTRSGSDVFEGDVCRGDVCEGGVCEIGV